MTQKIKILFLCTGNSCRSQMAEGWARTLKSDSIEAYSAGIETHGLNPDLDGNQAMGLYEADDFSPRL